MTVIITLSTIAVFILTLMLIRVGVITSYENGVPRAEFTIAGFRIPARTIAEIVSGKHKVKKESTQETSKSVNIPLRKLVPIISDVLGKLRQGLKISKLTIHIEVGGDPYSAAILCGSLNEMIGFLYPAAVKFLNVKKADILIMPNFTSESNSIDARLRLSFRIGTLIRAALTAATQYLNIRKDYKNGKTSLRRPDGDSYTENTRDGRRKYHSRNSNYNA
ncbi:MAG: DUF2953 domain-containing protein [Oscillospiraceae bacterium]|jgi:hypothetical protein|nr:DUF2953 domain-containing protein [Oscillospiraceae bacterium]